MRAKPQRSLKSRALQLLAQRDQSRLELRRKLLRHARREAASDAPAVDPQVEVDALLEWLSGHALLSDERFAESRVHARESRFGNVRIRSELSQHGVLIAPATRQALADSESARAALVLERRFGTPPADAAEAARQARFLAGRGFSPDVIHRLMKGLWRPGREA